MLLKEHKELKAAIIEIPPKEKDKLLLRLIAKDKILTERLHFRLLEDERDLTDRHQSLQKEIDRAIEGLTSAKKSISKDTLLVMRALNGMVNHHYKVTKDINTEVELRLYLLNLIPLSLNETIFSPSYKYQEKFVTYFLKTSLSVLNKYNKLHEDLQFDMKDHFNAVLNKIYNSKMASAAKRLDLPKEL